MPKKQTRRNIKKVLEGTSDSHESAFYKRPGRALTSAMLNARRNSVEVRDPETGERLLIHTHLGEKGKNHLLPSPDDTLGMKKLLPNGVKSHAIALKQNGKIVGYTFVRIKNPHASLDIGGDGYFCWTRYNACLHQGDRVNYKKYFDEYLAVLKKLGLQIRFVPNKEEGYVFQDGNFVMKNL